MTPVLSWFIVFLLGTLYNDPTLTDFVCVLLLDPPIVVQQKIMTSDAVVNSWNKDMLNKEWINVPFIAH